MTTASAAAPTTRQLATAAAAQAAARWQQVDPAAVTSGWAAHLPAVVAGVITAQIAAAGAAQSYLLAQGVTTRLIAAAFGGTASDGLPLAGLLFQPALTTLFALRRFAAPQAMAAGRASLDMIVRTQVADASRSATGAGITGDKAIIGYERVVHLPACGRCIILAGHVYRWSQGFSRHPRCDCTMHPVTREQHRTLNLDNHPRALFGLMTPEQQAKAFTVAGAQAIRDGADLGQVVNARSGMSTAVLGGQKLLTTTSGATRRGIAGQRLGARRGGTAVRLMPESIYKLAKDRDDAIRLLKLHGFIL